MQINFNWEILSSDAELMSMVVKYTRLDNDSEETYNIPMPLVGQSIEDHVLSYKPVAKWANDAVKRQIVEAGVSGTSVLDLSTMLVTATPGQIDSARETEITVIAQKVLTEMLKNSV